MSGKKTRDPRYKGDLRDEAARLYRAGNSVRAVAEKMELSPSRVYGLLNDGNVKLRPASLPKKKRERLNRKAEQTASA